MTYMDTIQCMLSMYDAEDPVWYARIRSVSMLTALWMYCQHIGGV